MSEVVAIAYLFPHDEKVYHGFMHSMLKVATREDRSYDVVVISLISGPLLAFGRNLLAKLFLETDATHLLMVDTDMHFNPEDVRTLLDARKDIIGGSYVNMDKRTNETFNVATVPKGDGWTHPQDLPEHGLVKVAAVGMGFTLIRRKVIEKLGVTPDELWPFAETVKGRFHLGEDATFCDRAKSAGFDTYLCQDVRLGHSKVVTLGELAPEGEAG